MEELKPCDVKLLEKRLKNLSAGLENMDNGGDIMVNRAMLTACRDYMAELLALRRAPADPQESEALDIIESLLDVADMKCTGPLYADDPPRSGMCRIPEEDAVKLRQYITNRRAAPENKALMVTLPCNIGDTVYEVENGLPIIAYYVTGFVLGKTEFEDEDDVGERQGWQVEYGKLGIDCECSISEFGKSLFLTREAAEQALNARKPEGSEKP